MIIQFIKTSLEFLIILALADYLTEKSFFIILVLLAGGFGSRISEESQFKPKPMIEDWWYANLVAHYERVCLL